MEITRQVIQVAKKASCKGKTPSIEVVKITISILGMFNVMRGTWYVDNSYHKEKIQLKKLKFDY
jgi:hypothetical protein